MNIIIGLLAIFSLLQDPPTRSQVGEAIQYQLYAEQQLQTARAELESIRNSLATQTAIVERAERAAQAAQAEAEHLLTAYLSSLVQVPPPVISGYEPAPDYSAAPFASLMPAFPQYKIPTIEDCEWIIRDNVATSTKGLPSITKDSEGAVCGAAYRASIAAGHELPITFGVWDNAGPAILGGQWNPDSARSIAQRDGAGGWQGLSVEFLGLDEQCEVNAGWATGDWGRTDYIGLFNIGLRGMPNNFIITANKPHGQSVLDGCWFLNHSIDGMYNAGLHTANWDSLVVRRMKARGERPTDPGPKFREHWCYFKSGGPMWIVENQMQGSNGTCFQIRPGADDSNNSPGWGPIVISHNRSHSYGFEWGDSPETLHGGSAISVWSSPNHPTFVYANEVTDARYGCLLFSGQGFSPFQGREHIDRNFYNDAGFPIGKIYLANNVFTNPRSLRDPVSISAVHEVHLWDNQVEGRWLMDSEWFARYGARLVKNGLVVQHSSRRTFLSWDANQLRYIETE